MGGIFAAGSSFAAPNALATPEAGTAAAVKAAVGAAVALAPRSPPAGCAALLPLVLLDGSPDEVLPALSLFCSGI